MRFEYKKMRRRAESFRIPRGMRQIPIQNTLHYTPNMCASARKNLQLLVISSSFPAARRGRRAPPGGAAAPAGSGAPKLSRSAPRKIVTSAQSRAAGRRAETRNGAETKLPPHYGSSFYPPFPRLSSPPGAEIPLAFSSELVYYVSVIHVIFVQRVLNVPYVWNKLRRH